MSWFIHRWGHYCMGLLTKITHCHNFTPAPPSWVRSCCAALNKMPYVLVDRGWLGFCYIRTGLRMMDAVMDRWLTEIKFTFQECFTFLAAETF